MDIMTACHISSPALTAIIPNANDTERYPRPIGIPSFNPTEKLLLGLFILQSSLLTFNYIPSIKTDNIPMQAYEYICIGIFLYTNNCSFQSNVSNFVT